MRNQKQVQEKGQGELMRASKMRDFEVRTYRFKGHFKTQVSGEGADPAWNKSYTPAEDDDAAHEVEVMHDGVCREIAASIQGQLHRGEL
jgi:hypothetical protein